MFENLRGFLQSAAKGRIGQGSETIPRGSRGDPKSGTLNKLC